MSGVEKRNALAPDSQRLAIRDAVAGDASLLTTLIHEFARFERLRAAITEDTVLRDGFGARPKFRALIAEWEGQAAGYALFFDHYSSFRGGRGIFLEDIYVRDQFRGKGAGKALFARLATIAQKEGCIAIMFNVLDWNSGAINFYRNLGATFLDDWKTISLEGSALEVIAQP